MEIMVTFNYLFVMPSPGFQSASANNAAVHITILHIITTHKYACRNVTNENLILYIKEHIVYIPFIFPFIFHVFCCFF